MLRPVARYSYGLSRTRLRALNDDLTRAEASNMIGGAGPFDFSSLSDTITAIPIFLKENDDTVVSETFDLTAAAAHLTAVTVDECVTALTAAAISGWTFSKDTTGRIKCVCGTENADVQLYGVGARLMMFGQGKGLKWIKSDTVQTFNNTPTLKEDTTNTVTDANGKDTEVIISGYSKGWTGTLVDTAEDFEMIELVESGVLSSDGTSYTSPISTTEKVSFEIESYNPRYGAGTNNEDQIVDWEKKVYRTVKGSMGDHAKAAGFVTINYNLVGVNYRTVDGDEEGAIITTMLPLASWSPDMLDAV